MDDRSLTEIVTQLYETGLSVEQQCLVAELLVVTRNVTVQEKGNAISGAERTRMWRERKRSDTVTSPVTNVTKVPSSSPPSLLPPIPPNNSSPSSPSSKIYRSNEEFDAFWHSYPRKVGKGAARKAYAKALLKTNSAVIASAVGRICVDEPEFIPHPATWLNQERWLDEMVKTKTNGKSYLVPGKPLQFKEKDEPELVPPTPEERERRLKIVAALKAATQAVTR